MIVMKKPARPAHARQEDTMWRKWTLGVAGICASLVAVGGVLGAPWPNRNDLPRIIIGALLLVSNGALMWRVERINRLSQEDYELFQLGKRFGGKHAMTWKQRFLGSVDGME